MMHVRAMAALVVLTSLAAPVVAQQPNLNGDWVLASATTNASRDGTTGERPTKTHTNNGVAFNCGRECRIVYKGSTLTVENPQLEGGDAPPSPAVTFVLDGRPHAVVDSFNPGNNIETMSRWEDGKLLITSKYYGPPITQTVSLEQNQLVVVTPFASVAGAKLTLRYTKKSRPPRVSYLSVASQKPVK